MIIKYIKAQKSNDAVINYAVDKHKIIQIRQIKLLDHNNNPSLDIDRMNSFKVSIYYDVNKFVVGSSIGVMLDKAIELICHTADIDNAQGYKIDRDVGSYKSTVEFPGGY